MNLKEKDLYHFLEKDKLSFSGLHYRIQILCNVEDVFGNVCKDCSEELKAINIH